MADSPAVWAAVTDRPLSVPELLERVSHPGHGAQTLFLGVVRDNHLGQRVEAVTYDAFVPLAEKVLGDIAREAHERWGPALRVALVHRTGRLAVGEASVAIALGSAHRDAAYQASRYVIEELKRRTPIWKKEHHVGGTSEWLDGQPLGGERDVGGHPRGRALDEDGT